MEERSLCAQLTLYTLLEDTTILSSLSCRENFSKQFKIVSGGESDFVIIIFSLIHQTTRYRQVAYLFLSQCIYILQVPSQMHFPAGQIVFDMNML